MHLFLTRDEKINQNLIYQSDIYNIISFDQPIYQLTLSILVMATHIPANLLSKAVSLQSHHLQASNREKESLMSINHKTSCTRSVW